MERIVLVTKPTRLQELIREHLTQGAAEFVLESRGESISAYVEEDKAVAESVALVRQAIPSDLMVACVDRTELPNFLFRPKDLIIVCGPDGLLANAAKYIEDQLVLTVNPDPKTVKGALMLFLPQMVGKLIASIREGKQKVERLPLVRASIDGEKVIWGLNDIFIGRLDHVSARYRISFNSRSEQQSSSGIIVSTGIGSSGWIASIVSMFEGLMQGPGNSHLLRGLPRATEEELVFVVREPFPSPTTGISIISGRIIPGAPLTATSEMPSKGYIFSDGVVERAVEWKAGSSVTVSVGDRYLNRIVP